MFTSEMTGLISAPAEQPSVKIKAKFKPGSKPTNCANGAVGGSKHRVARDVVVARQRPPPTESVNGGSPVAHSYACLEPDLALPAPQLDRQSSTPTTGKSLADLIEREVIPRLMMLHKSKAQDAADKAQPADGAVSRQDILELSRRLLADSDRLGPEFVEQVRNRGVRVETILLDLLAPAARHLGELWEMDSTSFVQVTVALSRLQQILRGLSPPYLRRLGDGEFADAGPAQRILLLPAPGEQHTFGLLMVEEFFRAAGWEVWGGLPGSRDEIKQILGRNSFSIVGYSLGHSRMADGLKLAIQWTRKVSRNPNVAVMVGGYAFSLDRSLWQAVGADASAQDAHDAVHVAKRLIDATAVNRLT